MSTTQKLETRVRLSYTENGKPKTTVLDEERASSWAEEFTANQTPFNLEASQSFTYHNVSVETPDQDFAELVPNNNERADLINTALDLKAQGFIRKTMLAKDFTPVEGSYDLKGIYNMVSERKTMTTEEKAVAVLSKLLGKTITADDLAAIVGSLQS